MDIFAPIGVDINPPDIWGASGRVIRMHTGVVHLIVVVPPPVEWDHIQGAFQVCKVLVSNEIFNPASVADSAHNRCFQLLPLEGSTPL